MRWLGLVLFASRLSKPYPDCLGTTIAPFSNLKFYSLSFPKGIIVYPLNLAAVEEELFSPLRLNKPKATVCK